MITVGSTIFRDRFWDHLVMLGSGSSFRTVNLVTYCKFFCLKWTLTQIAASGSFGPIYANAATCANVNEEPKV